VAQSFFHKYQELMPMEGYVIHINDSPECMSTTIQHMHDKESNIFRVLHNTYHEFSAALAQSILLPFDHCVYLSFRTISKCKPISHNKYLELGEREDFSSFLCPIMLFTPVHQKAYNSEKIYVTMTLLVDSSLGRTSFELDFKCEDLAGVSFNVTDVVGIGNKAEFSSVTRKHNVFHTYGTAYTGFYFHLEYYPATFQMTLHSKTCTTVQLQKTVIQTSKYFPILHKMKAKKSDYEQFEYGGRTHIIVRYERAHFGLHDVNKMCSNFIIGNNIAHAFTYYSDIELSNIAEILNHMQYSGLPVLLFTGFKADKVSMLLDVFHAPS